MPTSLTVLVVSPLDEDHARVRNLCREGRCRCHLLNARCRQEALPLARRHPFSLVLSERDLPDGSWKDLWEQIGSADRRPPLIVTSAQADSSLWAEVLNLGGYDVLAKPLDEREILHVLVRAWEQMDRAVAPARAAA